jgi:hypothetical protein
MVAQVRRRLVNARVDRRCTLGIVLGNVRQGRI